MAYRQMTTRRRQNVQRASYVYGNVVRQPAYEPERRAQEPKKKRTSRQVKNTRRQALRMNRGYVVFMAVAAIAMLLVCIKYVNLQSANMSHAKKISAMEEELATLKEENTTRYNAIVDSVNLDEVRKKAKKDLGMVDASDSQVVEYKKPSLDYVKQYESIPKEGALTKVQTKKSK